MHYHPKRRFGQNFLQDKEVIERIIKTINPQSSDHIVEIGPGLGALTTHLLPLAKQLDVVEFDRDLIPRLEEKCRSLGHLSIHQANALQFDFAGLAQKMHELRVVGNLPYNISTPLIFHLLTQAQSIQDMYFMLQKEVVMRLAAKPDNKSYGRLSVMMQYHCQVTDLFTVPPSAFHPQPKVDSAIVKLVPYSTYPHVAKDFSLFSKLVSAAFNHRRKTLHNSLKDIVDTKLIEPYIDLTLRAENLSIEDYVEIANQLTDKAGHRNCE